MSLLSSGWGVRRCTEPPLQSRSACVRAEKGNKVLLSGAGAWTCSTTMERPAERDARGKWKRKRRRRRNGRDEVNASSSFIGPVRRWASGASAAEDASSTSSLEVKENQDDSIHQGRDLLLKYLPSAFCTGFPRHGHRALKRKLPLVDGNDQRLYQSRPTKRSAWATGQKNALVQLNELLPGLRYENTSKTGPLHAPVFSVGVEVNGLRFEGRGPTKKRAKLRAAELALRSFVQFPNASQAHAAVQNQPGSSLDFTADKTESSDSFQLCSLYQRRRLVRLTLDLVSTGPRTPAFSASLAEQLGPVALLNQLRPGLRYLCLTESVPGWSARRFVMVVRVEGRVFEGCAHSKRRAKAQAAAAALQALHSTSLGPGRTLAGLRDGSARHQLPQVFAESIFHLVTDKYTELTDSRFPTSHSRHKVLAGIVMTRGSDLTSARVVSLATGTKCLDSDKASERGSTLSDCHAEVVCRRALLRFLYAQLDLLLRPSADAEGGSVFVPDELSGGFRLRNHVLFHMFVSSSPCGDARLSCPYETTATYPSRRLRCHLRAKASGGEGTRRTAQGREGASSMSCTDKMAKWSAVGLQGALLSRLVGPVYLHSLTVATLRHTGHLNRAMTRRLAAVRHLPFPYRRQRLLLGCLSSTEVRPTGKAPNVSVNWTCGDAELEEISTSTGRTGSGAQSRLCRRSLMARWQRLQQQLNDVEAPAASYAASKAAAGRYQRAVQRFGSGLQAAGLGTWIRKPPEPTDFSAAGS